MKYYQITAHGPAVAESRIDGPIGDSWMEETVTAKQFVADLEKITAQRINLYVNSPGGSVMDATAIASALHRHPATINAVVDGWALSAASLIVATSDTVAMGQRSLIMIHNPALMIFGDARGLRKGAEILDKVKAGMVTTYDARLKQGPEAVSAILDEETWMTAQEALDAGFADSIVEDNQPPSPVPTALRNSVAFKHIPAAVAAYFKETSMTDKTKPQEETTLVTPVSDPVITPPENVASIIDARVDSALKNERARITAIRAAFAPWIKRGHALSDLQAQCEDDSSDINAVNTRILARLGSIVEPLAGPKQGQTSGSDPFEDAVTDYLTKHPGTPLARAHDEVLKANPKLYETYISRRA